jgi:hypothetical protein
LDVLLQERTRKNRKTLDYTIRFVCYVLILLPAVLGVLYVRAFGVSVVQRDAWSMVPLFHRWSSGTLQVSDFFVQHFEHRSTFPEIAMLLLGIITKYNNVAEMYLIQACLLVTLIVLFIAFRGDIKSPLELLLFVPISLLVFSFKQHHNMLFGYQINFAFAETFGVLALFLLYIMGHVRFQRSAYIAALASATVASYSIVAGLLAWPAGLLQLFISPLEKLKKRILITLWSLMGVSVWVAYLWGWDPHRDCSSFIDWCQGEPSSQSSALSPVLSLLRNTLEHPIAVIDFFLNLLASSLLWPKKRALEAGLLGEYLGSVVGLLLVCLALVGLLLAYKSRRLGEYSFWISFMSYSFLILAATTIGRSGEVELALAQRYTSFSVLALVSIYGLLATSVVKRGLSITRPSTNTILVVFLSGVVLVSAPYSYWNGIKQGRHEKAKREEMAYILYTYKSQPDELLSDISGIGGRGAWVIRERAPVLERLGYNVFSEPQPYRPLKKYDREK